MRPTRPRIGRHDGRIDDPGAGLPLEPARRARFGTERETWIPDDAILPRPAAQRAGIR